MVIEILHSLVIGAIKSLQLSLLFVNSLGSKHHNTRINAHCLRISNKMTTAGNGNRAHRLWQGSCCQLAVLQHFQAGRNLRNYHFVQTALWHILTSSNSISYIFNNGIFGYSHILASQVLWLLSLFILASNQLVIPIGIRSNLYIKTTGLSKSHRQHIRNSSI